MIRNRDLSGANHHDIILLRWYNMPRQVRKKNNTEIVCPKKTLGPLATLVDKEPTPIRSL
ncbi:hypothetical protein [Alkaliphilus metalliredigens]|uniref:hypothetical protein n=1 Tax=Alkaliphilus metalliredigens TaxID=208226 RepID=UPI0005A08790|nr:hypothetical protein [Alkaliphilus metalliredigens]